MSIRPLLVARTARGFADGFASVLLALYLDRGLGFDASQISVIVTATLIGSAALTMYAGLRWHRRAARTVLLWSCGLMAATGIGFATVRQFWPLVLVALVSTLNPSGGDVSLFLPTEQAFLTDLSESDARTSRFGIYNVCGALGAAAGALCSTLPGSLARRYDGSVVHYQRVAFLVYVAAALIAAVAYRRLPHLPARSQERRALHRSRSVVTKLSVLFSLDAAGGGLVVQTMLVLYLSHRFAFDERSIAALLAICGTFSALSQLMSARIAQRFGLVRTMVFTHLPANALLVVAGISPFGWLAIAALVARSLVSAMDVPARQALVMTLVLPEERAAAASVTNVPRSIAAAATPLIAGRFLAHSTFGWPLIIAGVMKAAYDLLLLRTSLESDLG